MVFPLGKKIFLSSNSAELAGQEGSGSLHSATDQAHNSLGRKQQAALCATVTHLGSWCVSSEQTSQSCHRNQHWGTLSTLSLAAVTLPSTHWPWQIYSWECYVSTVSKDVHAHSNSAKQGHGLCHKHCHCVWGLITITKTHYTTWSVIIPLKFIYTNTALIFSTFYLFPSPSPGPLSASHLMQHNRV